MADVSVNLAAVLVAALVNMVLGGLWYSPLLFGKTWMKLSNIPMEKMGEMKKQATKSYAIAFVAALVMSYVLAHFATYMKVATIPEGAQLGFWIWLGFVVPVSLGSVLWEGKGYTLFGINVGYYLVSLLIMGSIFAVWQ